MQVILLARRAIFGGKMEDMGFMFVLIMAGMVSVNGWEHSVDGISKKRRSV